MVKQNKFSDIVMHSAINVYGYLFFVNWTKASLLHVSYRATV